jgi:DNA topoisomerase-3
LTAKFAESKQCRMLALVEHFGDSTDSAQPCGHCDACAPGSSLKLQASPPGGFAVAPSPNISRRGRKGKGAGARRGRSRKSRKSGVALPASGPSAGLVASLRAWRLLESKKKRVPAFRVLTNRALVAIAQARPTNAAALRDVKGVGPKLFKSYGAVLVSLCTRS